MPKIKPFNRALDLFLRDPEGRATSEFNPECRWVLNGAHATKMYDGVGYLFHEDFIAQFGKDGCPPDYNPDETGVPYDIILYHQLFEARKYHDYKFEPWSYELVGPGIKGNHEQQPRPILIPHGRFIYQALTGQEITPEKVRKFLTGRNTEGIVFWEDIWDCYCRKAKIKQADFGMKRNIKGDQE